MPIPFSGVLASSQQLKGPQLIYLYRLIYATGMKGGEVCRLRTEVFISVHLLNPEMTPAEASWDPFKFGAGVEKD